MTNVRVYDPAMCCSTGVCGPETDATVAQFAAALDRAKKSGVVVDRYTLAHQPGEYVRNAAVKSLLDAEGVACLPIVFVGDEIVAKGSYPTGPALFEKLGIAVSATPAASSTCCSPAQKASGGCCS